MSITELADGSKLDECRSHEPYVWGRGWTVLGICLGKKSTGWRWKILCPCINCLNGRRQLVDDIWEHLLCDVEMGDRLEDMICDLGHESFHQAHVPLCDTL